MELFIALSDHLWLEQKVLSFSNEIFQILAHQVA
jgi:hypothetical protein